MNRVFCLLCLFSLVFCTPALCAAKDRDIKSECTEALSDMDDNMVYKTRRCHIRMSIQSRNSVYVKELEMVGKGANTSLTRVIKPPAEIGTKFLRFETRGRHLIYMYLPSSERVIRVSGHMLRQSALGSDLSYEDLLDSPRLDLEYEVIKGEEIVHNDLECYQMDLKARRDTSTYPKRQLVIEKKRRVPVIQKYFARGGKLVKQAEFSKVKKLKDRYYPHKIVMRDMLRKNSKTTLDIYDLEFGVKLPRRMFTRRYLEREW